MKINDSWGQFYIVGNEWGEICGIGLKTESAGDILSKKNISEVGKDMSVILIGKAIDGLVFVSDSKSSLKLANGKYELEKGRFPQKLFKMNDDCIIGTFGINTLTINNERIFLEDIINDVLSSNPNSKDDFIEQIRAKANKDEFFRSHEKRLNFVFGYKEEGKYLVSGIEIACDKKRDVYPNLNQSQNLYVFGSSAFAINGFGSEAEFNCDTDEVKSRLIGALEAFVYLGDTLLPYNPIGLPSQKLVLQ